MPSLSGVTGERDQSLGSSQSALNGQQIFANCFSEYVKLSDEKSDSDHCKEKLIQKIHEAFHWPSNSSLFLLIMVIV